MSYVPEHAGQTRAFFLSVLGSAAAVAILFTAFLVIADGRGAEMDDVVGLFFAIFIVAAVIIMIVAGLLGLPLTYLLAHHRLERSWSYPLAGFVLGGGLLAGWEVLFGWAWQPMDLLLVLVGGVPGAFCGAIWWFFYRSLRAVGRDGSPI